MADITTTTTTSTPIHPLSIVQTIFYDNIDGTLVANEVSDGSNNSNTKNTAFANSFSFGTIAPGQTSKIVIVSLNVPKTIAINNIKLAIIDTGGIEFTNTTFGITINQELKSNIVPSSYFQDINGNNSANNSNNINISNRTLNTSNYVYLTINLAKNNFLGSGIIRYKWFFDYVE